MIQDKSGGCEFRQYVESGQGCRIVQDRQLDQILDRTRPELGPDSFVFAPNFLVARVSQHNLAIRQRVLANAGVVPHPKF